MIVSMKNSAPKISLFNRISALFPVREFNRSYAAHGLYIFHVLLDYLLIFSLFLLQVDSQMFKISSEVAYFVSVVTRALLCGVSFKFRNYGVTVIYKSILIITLLASFSSPVLYI